MPLIRQQTGWYCGGNLIPDKNGKPVLKTQCGEFAVGKQPDGWTVTRPPTMLPDGTQIVTTEREPTMSDIMGNLQNALCNDPGFLGRLAEFMPSPNRTISPQTVADLYGAKRSAWIPLLPDPASNVIASLGANATSTALTIDTSGIERVFRFIYVELDTGTSYSSIAMTVYVNGRERYEWSGRELDPATNNGCIAQACKVWIAAGSIENITVTFTNTTGVALGAGARVRVQGERSLPGEEGFAVGWRDYKPAQITSGSSSCGCGR